MTVAGGAQVETPGPWASEQAGLPAPPYAAWGRRVVAAVLDGMIGSGVAFLALGAPALTLPFLGVAFGYNGSQPAGQTTWTHSGWAWGTVVIAVLMQAYLGATPGKLVMGLAVVREVDARPIGLLRTLVRAVLHLLDAILLIGYLFPLWSTRRQTIADMLTSTVVLHTRRPRAHPWLAGPDRAREAGPPVAWESPSAPRWIPVATAVSAVACAAGAAFAGPLGGSQTSSGPVDLSCVMTTTDPGESSLTGGTVTPDLYPATLTRLGVTRRTSVGQAPRVVWQLAESAAGPTISALRVSFTSADGTTSHSDDFPGPGVISGTGSEQRTLPADTLDGLGATWSWRQTIVVDGIESPACTGSITTR